MRKVAQSALLAIAVSAGALAPAYGQSVAPPPNNPPVTIVTHGATITPLAWFAMGSIACAAVSPMIGTVILGRELTIGEAYHTTLGCLLGPPGWLLADALFPSTAIGSTPPTPPKQPRSPRRVTQGRHINIPPAGATTLVLNEVLLEFAPVRFTHQYEASFELGIGNNFGLIEIAFRPGCNHIRYVLGITSPTK